MSFIPLQHVQPSATCLPLGGPGQGESGAACSGLVRLFPDAVTPAVLKVRCRLLTTSKKRAKFSLGSRWNELSNEHAGFCQRAKTNRGRTFAL